MSSIPQLTGLNSTEYWIVWEHLQTKEFEVENQQGFHNQWIATIKLPSGDRYYIEEMFEHITQVKKLERKDNEEDIY